MSDEPFFLPVYRRYPRLRYYVVAVVETPFFLKAASGREVSFVETEIEALPFLTLADAKRAAGISGYDCEILYREDTDTVVLRRIKECVSISH